MKKKTAKLFREGQEQQFRKKLKKLCEEYNVLPTYDHDTVALSTDTRAEVMRIKLFPGEWK